MTLYYMHTKFWAPYEGYFTLEAESPEEAEKKLIESAKNIKDIEILGVSDQPPTTEEIDAALGEGNYTETTEDEPVIH